MSYRLIDSNMLANRYPEVNDMPCIYLDLPNGLDSQHHGTILPKEATNGEMFKVAHPDAKVEEPTNCPWEYRIHVDGITFTISKDWWDALYKENKHGTDIN